MGSQLTLRLDGLGFGAPSCSDIFERAEKLQAVAIDARRFERWTAYKWLIREYRRYRLTWDTAAGGDIEDRCAAWGVPHREYALYLDRCRETFGLTPVINRLAALPLADERREALITERDEELEDHRRKYDPYYLNVQDEGSLEAEKRP